MSIADMRVKLDQRLFSETDGFAEQVTFQDAAGNQNTYPVYVKTRVRPVYSDADGTMKEMEDLEITIRKSDLANAKGYFCRRQAGRGTDQDRWFVFAYEVDSDKPTRYKATFERELIRTAGVSE